MWLQTELEKIPGWSDLVTQSTWGTTRKEQAAIETLRRFVTDFGWVEVGTVTRVNGVLIGRFVGKWRTAHRRGQLDPRIAEQLEAIPGWSWESTYPREHHRRFLALLRAYVAEHGWEEFSHRTLFQGFNLGSWCGSRREDYRKKKLADWLRRELEAIPGWRWRMREEHTAPADDGGA